jgi:hypothetical protein
MNKNHNSQMIADYNLGSRKAEARRQAERLLEHHQKEHPDARLQISQHAPEGYRGAYSAQIFIG